MLPLSSAKWVFFRVERGDEQYVTGLTFTPPSTDFLVEISDNVREALSFPTAREAYDYAYLLRPLLDDYRVGLRAAVHE
jgi:hypothetical protein